MILSFLVALSVHADNLPKRDYSTLSKWEEQEINQAKQLLEKNLPAVVCGDADWAIGLRRLVWAAKEAFPDKDFELTSVSMSPPGKAPNDVTMCGVISVRAPQNCAPPKADEKKEDKSTEKP